MTLRQTIRCRVSTAWRVLRGKPVLFGFHADTITAGSTAIEIKGSDLQGFTVSGNYLTGAGR